MATFGDVAHWTLNDDDVLDFTRVAGAGAGPAAAAAAAAAFEAGHEDPAAAPTPIPTPLLLVLPTEERLARWRCCLEFHKYTWRGDGGWGQNQSRQGGGRQTATWGERPEHLAGRR